MSGSPAILQGIALHAGVPVSVVLSAVPGPTSIAQNGLVAAISDLRVERADRGVCVTDPSGKMHVDLVEHLFAAIGALELERGLLVSVDGPELPLMDGGARAFALALRALRLPSMAPSRRILRAHRVEVGESVYEFEPGDRVRVQVHVQFDHPLVRVQEAAWAGDAEDFLERIAAARTFGFLREADALRATSRARGANTRDVIVLCDDGTSVSEPGPSADECVRHKLLDLVGDLTIAGGIPVGTVRAWRPGHRATHEVMARAIDSGVFG